VGRRDHGRVHPRPLSIRHANPFTDWGEAWGPTAAPGLVLSPTDDPFGDDLQSREVAAMLGASHELIPEAGHWWPFEAPERAATLLRTFFSSID